ncbi:MAG: sigma-54-dependent Fis family transcriptional regulator [Bdellovibrionales bacterium]|nr:sigma-54-dependent Fis family transcriptional regulator [Bdellovibrionales bacterium]
MRTDVSSLEKQAIRLRLLNELSTNLQGLLESENFYQEVINLVQSKFSYFAIQIWSVDSEQDARLEAQAGAYQHHLKMGHLLQSSEAGGVVGIVGQVIRTKKSYLTNDISQDPNYTDLSLQIQTQSELTVPILKEGQLIAVLNVESDELNAFDDDDVITLQAVAAQVAVAMTNRRLYADARSFNKKLQSAVEEKTLELRHAHERILEQQRMLQKENKALKSLVQYDQKSFEIIGKSAALSSLLTMVDKIAPTSATVLIQGESGTGKELIARKLHFQSDRADQPYVVVNCGALQESLLESELFGHEKGSFTGALTQKMGLCETADNGTIFLDEIGELSLPIQAKLLRFLQEGEFYRLGGKRPIQVNVRVISATNRDLEVEVREGRFREDLYYRLNTITLRMPPLRKRKEDIAPLVQYFLQNSRFGGPIAIRRVDPRVMDALQQYDWPGNIRELQNTIERLKILAEHSEIRLEDLPFNIRMPHAAPRRDPLETPGAGQGPGLTQGYSAGMLLEEVEKGHILKTLEVCQGNKTRAAQQLGITIKTLYNKLHRYGAIRSPLAEGPDSKLGESTL